MTPWQRNLYLLGVGVFIAQAGFSIVVPFLPALVEELGGGQAVGFWSGLLLAVNFLTYSLMAPVWGSLSDRVGKRPMMVRAGLGIALTYVFMAFSGQLWQLALWRAVNGLISGYIPAANALVASTSPDERLGWSLGFLQGASAAGLVSGPLIGGLAAEWAGVRGALLVAALLLGLAGLLPLWLPPEPAVSRSEDRRLWARAAWQGVRDCLADAYLRRLFGLQALFVAGQFLVQPTLPLYVAERVPEDPLLATGVVYSVVGVATAVGSPLASRFSDRDAGATLRWALASSAALAAVHAAATTLAALTLVRFVFALCTSAAAVALGVLIARRVPATGRGATFGVLQSVTGVASAVGPLLGGVVGDTLGLEASFWAMALTLAAGWFFCPGRPRPAPALSGRGPTP